MCCLYLVLCKFVNVHKASLHNVKIKMTYLPSSFTLCEYRLYVGNDSGNLDEK